jgi:Xaa-Pro aminopeptidase
MRHEVPVAIGDPFLYAETDDTRAVTASSLERDRLADLPGLVLIGLEELGWDELLAERARWDVELEIAVRAVERLGIREAAVPLDFPVALADRLRVAGVDLHPDAAEFTRRRRTKTAAEIEGLRRAQRAADAGMARAAAILRDAVDVGPEGELTGAAGERLTAEGLRAEIVTTCKRYGATLGVDAIVGPGGQGAAGHDPGSGPLPADVPIIIDIWPQDDASGCYADMTRTFVVGAAPDDVKEWHGLAKDALERVREAVRPGVSGKALWELTCDVFEAAGHPTQRTKRPGEVLKDGFFHGLGHGVGLAVHEEPGLGRGGDAPLLEGDVIAVEPGTYRQGYGGVRLEDLLLVTGDGCETLTDFPYDLAP